MNFLHMLRNFANPDPTYVERPWTWHDYATLSVVVGGVVAILIL